MDATHRAVIQLVETLTDSRSLELDFEALRKLKQICKTSQPATTRLVFDAWFERLKTQDARVSTHLLAYIKPWYMPLLKVEP